LRWIVQVERTVFAPWCVAGLYVPGARHDAGGASFNLLGDWLRDHFDPRPRM